ncbi:MucR family transcriptional regulator [Xanthobacter sp. VNH20]|uniref:MucR family transcriptional regulator n=1 Tax=Xanthobacter sp. VNH20 TaxID=3156616 RepID=UPI0032B401CE
MTDESNSALNAIYVELAAEIVAAYVSNNSVAASEIASLIETVHTSISNLTQTAKEPEVVPLTPAVSVRKSVTPDYIICLEDGKQFKSLKRHLRTRYDLTPEEYRAKWGLPSDYPMVAPNYAAARSELAKASGLGQLRKTAAAAPVATKPAAKRRAPAKKS